MDKLHVKLISIIEEGLKVPFKLHIYGSYASGLSLPTSDVDFLLEFEEGEEAKYHFDLLEEIFRQSSVFQEVKYIKTAQIPVMKLTTSAVYDFFKIDITIKDMNHYGLNCVDFVKKILQYYEPLKPILLVIKHLLNKVQLNDPYKGGLSSYGLILMILAFFQQLQLLDKYEADKNHYGQLLIKFLHFYSSFDHHSLVIQPSPLFDQIIPPFPQKKTKNLQMFQKTSMAQNNLIIIDPLNPYNNVASSTYQYILLDTIFTNGYLSITQICHCEIEKLHQNILNNRESFKNNEVFVSVDNGSILEKFFQSDQNLLLKMYMDNTGTS